MGRFGLRGRMGLSFLATSILVMLLVIGVYAVASWATSADPVRLGTRVHASAAGYAGRLAAQPNLALSPDHPFPVGQSALHPFAYMEVPSFDGTQTIIPAIDGSPALDGPITVAVVVDRSGTLVASSYPARFPVGGALTALVPETERQLARPLGEGRPVDGVAHQAGGTLRWTVAPIDTPSGVAGAVYVQAPVSPPVYPFGPVSALLLLFGVGSIGLALVLAPVGAVFGVLTMQGTVRRLQRLVEASRALAAGDFSRRVAPRGSDEVAELQRQFNAMAEQLDEAVQARERLGVQNAHLEERGRIARDLHDSMSQDLFSLRMRLAGLQQRHAADLELHRQFDGLASITGDVIRQMRALLLELRPPDTGGLDLETGIHELGLAYGSRIGMTTEVRMEPVVLDRRAQEAVLHIAQEALSNAARHSRADRVEIGLRTRDGQVELRVTDNGRGFAPRSDRHGLGLRLVRERVEELGGTMDLRSSPGGGTDLRVAIPAAEP